MVEEEVAVRLNYEYLVRHLMGDGAGKMDYE
jgi:hypothetical protein